LLRSFSSAEVGARVDKVDIVADFASGDAAAEKRANSLISVELRVDRNRRENMRFGGPLVANPESKLRRSG
jgi:hypothetical protein